MTHPDYDPVHEDAIDEFVDYTLSKGPERRSPFNYQVKCSRCDEDWHGMPKGSCMGSFNPDDPTARDPRAVSPTEESKTKRAKAAEWLATRRPRRITR